ncbi:MAG TPA: xanthine dehydrogenase family protein subunit M [Candidatus Limnocylindria bacterium]
MRPFSYARATDLADALRHVRAGAVPIAGGTDLLGLMKAGVASPTQLVDLSGIAELRGWTRARGKGLRIGPLTPLVDLETAGDLLALVPILAEALRPAATAQLRTMGTAGGNLLQQNRCWYFRDEAFPCWRKGGTRCFAIDGENRQHAILGAEECVAVAPSDLAPALIALDAEVTLRSARGARTIPLASLYVVPHGSVRREHQLRTGELITEIRIGEAALGRSGAFEKAMERRAWSFATVSVAAAARLKDGVARDVRIVLGGVAPVPWRARSAEALLEGRALDEAACAAAADAALQNAAPLRDNGYKVPLARELVRRTLRRIA